MTRTSSLSPFQMRLCSFFDMNFIGWDLIPRGVRSAGQSGTLTFTVGFAEEMSIVVVITDSFVRYLSRFPILCYAK